MLQFVGKPLAEKQQLELSIKRQRIIIPRGSRTIPPFRISKSIHTAFSSQRNRIPNSLSTRRFEKALLEFLIEAKLPCQVVEEKSFQRLLSYIQSASNIDQCRLPSANTVATWMESTYNDLFSRIMMDLKKQPSISYTVAVWTGEWMEPFISITAHWINEDWRGMT